MESNLGSSRKDPDPSGLSLPATREAPAGARARDEIPAARLEGSYLDGAEIHALLHSGYDMTRVFTNDERGIKHLQIWNNYQMEQSWLPSIASIATGAWQLGKEAVKNVVSETAEFTGLSKFDVISESLPDKTTSKPPPRQAWMTDEDYAKSVETWEKTRQGTGSAEFAKSKLYQAEEAFAQNVRGFWMMANANMGANSANPMARMQRVIRGSIESIVSPDTSLGDKALSTAMLGVRASDALAPIKFGNAVPYIDRWDSPEKRIADINEMMKDYQRGLRFESGESGILFEHDVTENNKRIRVAELLKQDPNNINLLSSSENGLLLRGLMNASRTGLSAKFDEYQPPAIFSSVTVASRRQQLGSGGLSPDDEAMSYAAGFRNLPAAEKTVVLDEVIRQSRQNIARAHDDLTYLDPRKMPIYKIYFDPTNALPYGAGRSAVSAVVGAERAAKWGNSILEWQANWQKFIGSKAGEGLNISSEFVRKEITGRLTGWVDDGIEFAGKHVSVATNITADQFSKAAKTIGYVAGAAGFAGIGVPYASAAAMTYGGLKLIGGVAESTAKVGTTMARQSGERGLLNFARETLLLEEQIAAKAGTTVPLQNKLALTALSLSEPIISTTWQATKAASAGAAVGATMTAFGAPTPDQFWQSVGTAGAMGLTGGLVGGVLSEVHARKALNLENQAAVILNVKKPFDPALARQLEILRTMTSTDVFGSTNLHRQAVNEFIVALSNKREGIVPELYLHFGQESVNAQVKAWTEKGYRQVDGYNTKLGAVEHAAGYVFKSPSGRDVIGINMHDFFARTEGLYGRHTLLHELTHTFNNDATLGPMLKHRIMNTIVGHFIGIRSENGERTYALQSRSNSQSWASVSAFMDSAVASLRQDAAEASGAGPDLARERGSAFTGDVEATEAVFASIKDKLAPEKFGDKAVPLTQQEFDALAGLAEEYYTTYTEGRGFDPKRVYLGGRTEGLGAALSMLADSIVKTVPKALRRNVDHAQGIGLFGKDYDLSRGFLEKNGKWRVMRDLDDIYYDTLKMESALRDTGKINLNELSPAGREVAMYNLGMDQMLFRDSTGRVVRGRRGAVVRPNETILMGTEAIKVIRALKPELRSSRETADGGIAGPFSDAEFDALVQSGFMSPQYADNCRLLQSIANDKGQGKIINFIYNGESRQIHTDADNVRLFGDSVPVSHRTAYVIDHTIEFSAKGEFISRIRTLDLLANVQRLQNLWRDADVRKLWNERYDDFERDYFETYLGNASLPEGHPEKVDSATALGKNGEAKRQVMHQAAGFTKADDLSWINLPIAQIPRGTLSTITDFSVGRMAVITQESHGRSFHYEHKNAFYPISRNFRPSTLRTEALPDGKMHSNDLGYKVLERENRFTLLSPDGTKVSEHTSIASAMDVAEDHFDKNVTKPVFARNDAIVREQATFRGKGLRKKLLSENKDVVMDPLIGENLYAFFAAMLTKHDMKIPEILEALMMKGYEFQYKTTEHSNGKRRVIFAADGINTREYSVQWSPNSRSVGAKNDQLLVSQKTTGVNGEMLELHSMTVGEFLSTISMKRLMRKAGEGSFPLVMRLQHGTPSAALLTDPNVHPSVSKAGTGYRQLLEGNLTRYYDLLTNKEMYVELTESQIRAGRAVASIMDPSIDWSSYYDFDNPGLVSLVQPDLGVLMSPLKRTPQVVVDVASTKQHYVLTGDHAGLARIAAGVAEGYAGYGDIVETYRQLQKDYPHVFEEKVARVGKKSYTYYTVKPSFAARPQVRDAVQSMVDSLGKQAIVRKAKQSGASVVCISRVPKSGDSKRSGLNDAVDILALDDGAIEKVGSNTVINTDSGHLVIDPTLRGIGDPSIRRKDVRIWNKSEKRLVTPLSMEEFRTGAGVVESDKDAAKQVSLFDKKDPRDPLSQLRYGAFRPKSKSGYRADSLLNTTVNYGNARVSKLEKIVRELLDGVMTRVASDRVYRNSGIVEAADVKEVHKRWSETAAVLKAEYDSGILSKEAYEANMDSIRLQVATEIGIVAQKAEVEADLHVAIQGLAQDISNLSGHVGSFISGSYWGDTTYGQTAKEVAEIGPICGNMRLDEALRLGRYADAPDAIEQITQAVLDGRHSDSSVWTLGGRAELDAAIGRLSVDVQRATDGLVDVVFVNRRDSRLATVEDQPVRRPTFVWTQKAIEIRNKYRQIIPEHVWKSQNMTWDSVRAEPTMGDRLRNLDWYANFERDVANAITAADRHTKGLLNTHDTRRQLALDQYTKKQTEGAADYDSYLKKMQEGRALVEQRALDEAIKAIEVERGRPLDRVVPEVDVEGLTSHHDAVVKAERLSEIYEQAKAAKDAGDANALRAFSAGIIDSVAQKALVDAGKEPEIAGTYYTDAMGVMGDSTRDVLAYNLKKMLDDSDFFKQVNDEYMQANYGKTFISPLRRIVDIITAKNPNGITASNFEVEMKKLLSQGIPASEEARVTGFADWLAEKKAAPNLPNGKKPKLDYAELETFLSSKGLDVEVDLTGPLDMSGNASQYRLSPDVYSTDYGVLIARTNRPEYWPNKRRVEAGESLHPREKGSRPGTGRPAKDSIAHMRYTVRDFPDLTGRPVKTLLIEEAQMGNDKKYLDSALASDAYWKALRKAIDETVQIVGQKAAKPAPSVEPAAISLMPDYSHDASNLDSVAEYVVKVHNGFVTDNMSLTNVLFYPHKYAAYRYGHHYDASSAYTGSAKSDVQMVRDTGGKLDPEQRRVFNASMAYADIMYGKVFAAARRHATNLVREYPGIISDYVKLVREKGASTDSNLTSGDGAEEFHLAFQRAFKRKLEGEIPYINAGSEAFGMLSSHPHQWNGSRSFAAGAASVFAGLIKESTHAKIVALMQRYMQASDIAERVQPHRGWSADSHFEALFGSTIDGVTYKDALHELVKSEMDSLPVVDARDRDGFVVKVHELKFRAGKDPDAFAAGYPEHVVRIPILDKAALARLAIEATECLTRFSSSGSYGRTELRGTMLGPMNPILQTTYALRAVNLHSGLARLWADMRRNGYGDWAAMASINDVIAFARANGIKVAPSFVNLVAAHKDAGGLKDLGAKPLAYVLNSTRRDVSGSACGMNSSGLGSCVDSMATIMRDDSAFTQSAGSLLAGKDENGVRLKGVIPYGTHWSNTNFEGLLSEAFAQAAFPTLRKNQGIPAEFAEKLGGTYGAVQFVALLRTLADARSMARHTSDPAAFLAQRVISPSEIFSIMQQTGYAKLLASTRHPLVNNYRNSTGATTETLHSVMSTLGLEGTPFYKFAYPERAPAGTDLKEIQSYREAYSSNSRTVPSFNISPEFTKPNEVATAFERAMAGRISPDELRKVLMDSYVKKYEVSNAWEHDRSLMRTPFLESEDYFGVTFKMALKHAVELGCERIQVIPGLDAGGRSGLPPDKAQHIYDSQYSAIGAKILKKLGIAAETSGRAYVPIDAPPAQIEAMRAKMDASTNAKNAALKKIYRKATLGDVPYVAKTEHALAASLIRAMFPLDRTSGTFPDTFLPAIASMPASGEAFASRNNSFSNLGMPVSKETVEINNYVALVSGEQRQGGYLTYKHPRFVAEIYAAHMYKAAKDSGSIKMTVPEASNHAKSQAMGALSWFHNTLCSRQNVFSKPYDRNVGLVPSDASRLWAVFAEKVRQSLDPAAVSALEASVKEYLDTDPSWLKSISKDSPWYQDIGDTAEFAKKITQAMRDLIDLGDLLHAEVEAHHEYYSSAKRTPDGRGDYHLSAMMTRNVGGDLVGMPDSAKKAIDEGQFFFRPKTIKGELSKDSVQWKSGFMGTLASELPKLASQCRLSVQQGNRNANGTIPLTVTLYPRVSEDLSPTHKDVSVMALFDPQSLVANVRILNAGRDSRHTLIALDEIERRLSTMGATKYVGDIQMPGVFGRIDTDAIQPAKSLSRHDMYSDFTRSGHGQEVYNVLEEAGYEMRFGALDVVDRTPELGATEAEHFLSQKPRVVRMSIEKNGNVAAYIDVSLRPDSTASVIDYDLKRPMPGLNTKQLGDKVVQNAKQMMVHELLQRLQTFYDLRSFEGINQIDLPGIDTMRSDFSGAIPDNEPILKAPKQGVVPGYENLESGYGRFARAEPERETAPKQQAQIPPRQQVWEMSKTGNYTTLTSDDQYFILLSSKGFRVYSPNKHLLGVFETEEEAKRKAYRDSARRKPQ